MLSVLDPLAAYREDLARSGRETLTPHDGPVIELALVLERLGRLPIDMSEQRATLEALAEQKLGEIGLPIERAHNEPAEVDPRGIFARVRVVGEWLRGESGWQLGFTMVRAAERAFPGDEHERGCALVIRARLARYAGSIETTEQLARETRDIARRIGSRDLLARSYIVQMVASQERGNYPRMAMWARRALAMAGKGPSLSSGAARQGLMIRAATSGEFNEALTHAWHAYQGFAGYPDLEAVMLINISKLLLDSGRPSPAVHGFIAAVGRQSKLRNALFAWGGLAGAAAAIRDRALVELATARIDALANEMRSPFAVACALVSVVRANIAMDMPKEPWAARAAALAARHGYHEIALEIDALREGSEPEAPRPVASPRRARREAPEVGQLIDAIESMGRIEDAYTVS